MLEPQGKCILCGITRVSPIARGRERARGVCYTGGVTCDEARSYLRHASVPQVVQRHLAECEPCRKAAGVERALRDALVSEPRGRASLQLPISRLWVNILAFVLGIAVPVAVVVAFRAPAQLGPEALLAHTLIVRGKAKVAPESDIPAAVQRELGFAIDLPPGALEGLRFHRLGGVRAAHLVVRRGDEPVSVLIFPRAKLESFVDALQGAKSLSRSVGDYQMLVKAGDRLVAVAVGKLTESEARELLAPY